MNVMDAALHVARTYPGGARALGDRMGKTNLADELNPNLPRSKFGLEDAVSMQLLAGRYDVLYAMALELRHFPPVPMPDIVDTSAPCLKTFAVMTKEFGGLIGDVADALSDNQVTNAELAAVKRKWGALVTYGQQLLAQMTAMNAEILARAPAEGNP